MQGKILSPALLVVILACVLVLLARDLRRGEDSRYRITTVGFAQPELVRVDVRSGEVWRLDQTEGRWIQLSGLPPAGGAEKSERPSPAPALGDQPTRAPESGVRVLAEPTAEDVQLYINTLLGGELPGEVRAWTAQQLSGVDTPEVTDALLQGLNDPDPEVVAACATVLAKRRDPRIRAAFEALRERPEQNKRQTAAPDTRVETLD